MTDQQGFCAPVGVRFPAAVLWHTEARALGCPVFLQAEDYAHLLCQLACRNRRVSTLRVFTPKSEDAFISGLWVKLGGKTNAQTQLGRSRPIREVSLAKPAKLVPEAGLEPARPLWSKGF